MANLNISPQPPVSSSYIVAGSNDSTLTADRLLTGTSNQIVITDNGANSTVVLSTPQNIDTSATVTFGTATLSAASGNSLVVDTNVFVVNATNNNVGIGTATPGSGINGTIVLDIEASVAGVIRSYIRNTDSGTTSIGSLTLGNDSSSLGAFFGFGSSNYVNYGGVNSLNVVNITSGALTLGTNNSIDITITNGGNVVVGNTTANANFDVSNAAGGTIALSRNDTSVTAADTIGSINFYTNDTSTTTNFSAAQILVQATNTITTDINPGRMLFYTTPVGVAAALTEAMRISNTQKVSIGTSADAAAQLEVGGDFYINQSSAKYFFSQRSTLLTVQNQTSGAGSRMELYAKDGDGTDAVGYSIFGVGTPTAVVDLEQLRIEYDNAGAAYRILSNSAGAGTLRPLMLLTTGHNNQLFLDISGNVGVGTATPNAVFDVSATTGGTIGLSRNDTSVTAADTIGSINFYTNDTSTTTSPSAAQILVQATTTITTDINPGRMIFYTTPASVAATLTEAMRISAAQRVSINTAADATALLHIAAGSATASTAPLKLTTGTLLTTPEVGAIEYDTNNFYMTKNTALRESISGVMFTQTADKTVASTVSETTLIGSGTGTATLPANTLVAGKTIRMKAWGYISATLSPTMTITAKLGTTAIATTGAVSVAGAASDYWEAEFIITCRSTGASGTVYGQGRWYISTGAVNMANTATDTVDTTAAQAVAFTAQWSASSSLDTITCTNFTIEVLN